LCKAGPGLGLRPAVCKIVRSIIMAHNTILEMPSFEPIILQTAWRSRAGRAACTRAPVFAGESHVLRHCYAHATHTIALDSIFIVSTANRLQCSQWTDRFKASNSDNELKTASEADPGDRGSFGSLPKLLKHLFHQPLVQLPRRGAQLPVSKVISYLNQYHSLTYFTSLPYHSNFSDLPLLNPLCPEL
jgi:hypothetical protein